jgi:endonuclease YncB( thermonuclease family)
MGILLGTFKIVKVIDGDTVEIERPPIAEANRRTLRFLNIDTEETHKPKDLGPVTEYGEEVTKLATAWYAQRGNKVELKTDGVQSHADFYGRALVQVFAGGDHYQKQAIANGWTPYYEKYGYSEEYHEIFVETEKKAQKDKLGVWSDKLQKRPANASRPYDLLKKWWRMRAEVIKLAMDYQKQSKSLYILVNGKDYMQLVGKAGSREDVQVFGEITRPAGGETAGRGLFIFSVKQDVPFYIYVSAEAKQRNEIIDYIERTFLSNSRKLPESLLKPNYGFVRGALAMFPHYGHQIPEIVITDKEQVSVKPF